MPSRPAAIAAVGDSVKRGEWERVSENICCSGMLNSHLAHILMHFTVHSKSQCHAWNLSSANVLHLCAAQKANPFDAFMLN